MAVLSVSSGVIHAALTPSLVDGTAVALEAALLIGAVGALSGARDRLLAPGTWFSRPAFGAVLPLLAVGVTSAALLSPSARDHATGSHGLDGTHADGDHGHTDERHDDGGDDKGFALLHNGHHAEIATYELDPASEAALEEQLAVTRKVAERFPTVADALGAGYRRAGPYSPGLGAHFVRANGPALNGDGRFDPEDLANPMSIMYDGTDPGSKVAGFMYYSMSPTEPEGFVGRNDVWHIHTDLCLRSGPDGIEAPFGADRQATVEQCEQVGGSLVKQTQWMVHVWSVPGYEHPDGVFAEHHPALTCADGTYYQLPAEKWADNLENVCLSQV